MNTGRFCFFLVGCLASLACVTTSAVAGEPGAIAVFVSPSQPVRLSSGGTTEVARVRMMLNFQASESHPRAQNRHPGGINIAMADGSVRFLEATTARLIVNPEGNIVEIQADMVDTRTGYSWSLQILPYIEQDNIYSFTLRVGLVELQYDAVGHLLPMMPTVRAGADRCLPDAGDVFRPVPPERFGHIDGDAANADGIWGLRFSPADHRRYFADHEAVLTDFTSDGF